MRRLALAAVTMAVSACMSAAPTPPVPPTAGSIESITYEASPCHGRCPVFSVQVWADGRGRFEGTANTAVSGVREFAVSSAQYQAYRDRLQPYRPQGKRRLAGEPCLPNLITDMPSIDVTWSGKGPTDRLELYLGCDPQANEALFEAVGRAPELLGITAWVRGD